MNQLSPEKFEELNLQKGETILFQTILGMIPKEAEVISANDYYIAYYPGGTNRKKYAPRFNHITDFVFLKRKSL